MDKRSARAVDILREAGFPHARALEGGMERWAREGLPVVLEPAPA
jgi:rhodanese-related sulfurtransferase